ncbi:MAG: hypothetical protein ACI9GM_001011 [Salibacteraceae bacterium]|jgi:hypothetical protein
MVLKQFIVPVDETVKGLGALRFVLRNFGKEKIIVNILWLATKSRYPEKEVDIRVVNSMVRLHPIIRKYRLRINVILDAEFQGIDANINVITINNFTRKQRVNYSIYAGRLFCTISVYLFFI